MPSSAPRLPRFRRSLMRRFRPLVALALVYLMTPMAVEITENVIHVIKSGHTAHALDDAEHASDDPEHCCSGPTHVCSCCHSTGFVASVTAGIGTASTCTTQLPWSADDLRADGHLARVFRPPIA